MSIEKLTNEIEEIKTKLEQQGKKDRWDKLKILSGFLIPGTSAFATFWISSMQHEAEGLSATRTATVNQEQKERQMTMDAQIANTNARIKSLAILPTYIDYLSSSNELKQRLAIKAVLNSFGQYGQELVHIVLQTAPSQSSSDFITLTVDGERTALVQQLFADDQAERITAYAAIRSGWRKDTKMVREILGYSNANMNNDNGIHTALITLKHMDGSTIRGYEKEIIEFCDIVDRTKGSAIKRRSQKLRGRLYE